MTPKLEAALKQTLEIIDKRILSMTQEGMDEPQPKVIQMDDGVLINYFEKWNVYHDDVLKRGINIDETDLSELNIFYIPKNGKINDNNKHIKTLICLDGKVDVIENSNNKTCTSLTAVDIKTNKFSVVAIKDSFVLLMLR